MRATNAGVLRAPACLHRISVDRWRAKGSPQSAGDDVALGCPILHRCTGSLDIVVWCGSRTSFGLLWRCFCATLSGSLGTRLHVIEDTSISSYFDRQIRHTTTGRHTRAVLRLTRLQATVRINSSSVQLLLIVLK
jgi:hypothetical protein